MRGNEALCLKKKEKTAVVVVLQMCIGETWTVGFIKYCTHASFFFIIFEVIKCMHDLTAAY